MYKIVKIKDNMVVRNKPNGYKCCEYCVVNPEDRMCRKLCLINGKVEKYQTHTMTVAPLKVKKL